MIISDVYYIEHLFVFISVKHKAYWTFQPEKHHFVND